ncbi:glycerol kinase 3-like protein [Dermatophagoides farinae]|uniref:glycerol kinase n=1 Tax=Dermatophagoides farinae TaxID=6954 RepID=A0A9D4P699_DERFA|nr:glycerol kinase-like [Dermatophagoides farinae]KAH7645510.1 glycerol kinase 3-like protein [Dermatophagoides farinae]
MNEERIKSLIGVIEQDTNFIRFTIISTKNGSIVTQHQVHVPCQYPQDGWIEQNPDHLFRSILEAFEIVYGNLCGNRMENLVECLSITTQRSTFIVWDRYTGDPLSNVIVWMDNRSKDLIQSLNFQIDLSELKIKTGLPLSHYFMASKLLWLFENDEQIKLANQQNRLMIGTIDSWCLWKLTGIHATDVTNASATLLMNLETVDWDHDLCRLFKVPKSSLPDIYPSSHTFGEIKIGPFSGVPITGMIADQQAALFGQKCLDLGDTNITFKDNCFLQQNIGPGPYREILSRIPVETRQKLILTIAYQLSDEQPIHYALEGSSMITGAAFDWLRDNLGLIEDFDEIESQASEENGGVYFVPAFRGLDAPYWDPNASGTIIGLSQFSRKSHLIRATLESVVHQTSDILDYLIETESSKFIVNGGLSCNNLLCQLLADISNKTIIRPNPSSISPGLLGAAMLSSQIINADIAFIQNVTIFEPKINDQKRESMKELWTSAVNRSRQWIHKKEFVQRKLQQERLSMIPFVTFSIITFALLIYSRSKS